MAVFVLENISKEFKVGKKVSNVLTNINVTFPDNGLVSIVGKSGSGKSTLLNILMGIEKPTSGKVFFMRKNIAKFNDKKFSNYHLNNVSLIFQHYNLFNGLTAFENAVLPLKMKGIFDKKIKEKTNALFERFGISNLAKRKVDKLSGGEKQRVAIIRALLTNPKAILCDEPTGALDSKNSREIMGILKEISDKTLVIMVSHNKQLVEEFSDQILVLKDGKIVNNQSNIKEKFTKNFERDFCSYSSGWSNKFFFLDLAKNFKRNLFSIIASAVAFTAMFISVGFLVGSKASQNEALLKNLQATYSTASIVKTVEVEGSPLSFTKQMRPSIEDVDNYFKEFSSIRYEENLSFFFSSYPTCLVKNEAIRDFQFLPLFDASLETFGNDLLINGEGIEETFDDVIINTEFSEQYGVDLFDEVILQNTAVTKYSTGNEENPFIKDTFSIDKSFRIVGIVKEFSFLNSPKIYFSYNDAKDYLSGILMENLSKYMGKPYNFYNFLCNCDSDNPAASYSSYVFITDPNEVGKFFDKISIKKSESLEINSPVLEIKNTYGTFIESFSTALIVFVIIAFLGINFILAMISLSVFLKNKKETAILTCLGARNSSIYNIYLSENFLMILLAVVGSFFLSPFLEQKMNLILSEKFSLFNLIQIPMKSFYGVPFGLPIAILFIALFFSYIFTMVPMSIYRNKSITDELRDE